MKLRLKLGNFLVVKPAKWALRSLGVKDAGLDMAVERIGAIAEHAIDEAAGARLEREKRKLWNDR